MVYQVALVLGAGISLQGLRDSLSSYGHCPPTRVGRERSPNGFHPALLDLLVTKGESQGIISRCSGGLQEILGCGVEGLGGHRSS